MYESRTLFICFFLLVSGSVSALNAPDIVELDEALTVDQAVSDLSASLGKRGLDIALTLDHSANAATVDLDLAATTVIFARPSARIEKELLSRGKTIGLDLPLKFLVFEQSGVIQLATNSAAYLIDRHDLSIRDRLFAKVNRIQNRYGADSSGIITVQSTRSQADTVVAIQDAILAPGVARIPLVIDFADVQTSSEKRRTAYPTLIVFGNPVVGTPLMQAQQSIGIDLPQKFLVWEDTYGAVNVSYNDPVALAQRHGIEGQDARLTAIAGALGNIANVGAGL